MMTPTADNGRMDAVAEVADRYRRFAVAEAPSRSSLYAEWAAGVADDVDVCHVLARIPASRRQPPLVFAVTRMLGAPEQAFSRWRDWLLEHADAVVAETSRRSLQTNEPLRCAALLPALATIPGPIGFLEVGASAGLCLQPDRYSYRYRRPDHPDVRLDPPSGMSPVVLDANITGDAPLRLPEIRWRMGADLTPMSAGDPDDRAFLMALVWPGERGRAQRIEAALDLARREPIEVASGDASDPDLVPRLLSGMPDGLTPVVSTLGLLPHLPRAARERLIGAIADTGAIWVSLDPLQAHDRWTAPVDPGAGRFVLHRDGAPLAYADPLGASLEWLTG